MVEDEDERRGEAGGRRLNKQGKRELPLDASIDRLRRSLVNS